MSKNPKDKELFDVDDQKNRQAFHFICHALGEHGLVEKVVEAGKEDPKGLYRIEFKINGIDVPFVPYIDSIYEHMQTQVDAIAAEKASELVGIQQLANTVKKLDGIIKRKIKRAFNVEINEDDYYGD